MGFEDILGQMVFENAVNFLKRDCKIERGFCSQKVGSNKSSIASTSIIIYVLKTLCLINEKEKNVYCKELLNFQIPEGHYEGAFGIDNDISDVTTWSTSQACLALEALGNSENNLHKASNGCVRRRIATVDGVSMARKIYQQELNTAYTLCLR